MSWPSKFGSERSGVGPEFEKGDGRLRPSLQQRLPGAEGPPEGCTTAPRHAACGGPIPSSHSLAHERSPVLIFVAESCCRGTTKCCAAAREPLLVSWGGSLGCRSGPRSHLSPPLRTGARALPLRRLAARPLSIKATRAAQEYDKSLWGCASPCARDSVPIVSA